MPGDLEHGTDQLVGGHQRAEHPDHAGAGFWAALSDEIDIVPIRPISLSIIPRRVRAAQRHSFDSKRRDDGLKHLTFLIRSASQIIPLAFDLHKNLVHVPFPI